MVLYILILMFYKYNLIDYERQALLAATLSLLLLVSTDPGYLNSFTASSGRTGMINLLLWFRDYFLSFETTNLFLKQMLLWNTVIWTMALGSSTEVPRFFRRKDLLLSLG